MCSCIGAYTSLPPADTGSIFASFSVPCIWCLCLRDPLRQILSVAFFVLGSYSWFVFFAISACVGEPLMSQGLGGFGDSVGLINYRVQYRVCWSSLPAGGLSAEPLLAQLMRVGRGPGFWPGAKGLEIVCTAGVLVTHLLGCSVQSVSPTLFLKHLELKFWCLYSKYFIASTISLVLRFSACWPLL